MVSNAAAQPAQQNRFGARAHIATLYRLSVQRHDEVRHLLDFGRLQHPIRAEAWHLTRPRVGMRAANAHGDGVAAVLQCAAPQPVSGCEGGIARIAATIRAMARLAVVGEGDPSRRFRRAKSCGSWRMQHESPAGISPEWTPFWGYGACCAAWM
jgi:hypothetical protein